MCFCQLTTSALQVLLCFSSIITFLLGLRPVSAVPMEHLCGFDVGCGFFRVVFSVGFSQLPVCFAGHVLCSVLGLWLLLCHLFCGVLPTSGLLCWPLTMLCLWSGAFVLRLHGVGLGNFFLWMDFWPYGSEPFLFPSLESEETLSRLRPPES